MSTKQLAVDSVADQTVVRDVLMSMDPAENLDESTSSLISPRSKASRAQVSIHQSTIKVPDYRHPKGFLHLAWDVKYGGFVIGVQTMNDELIDRETMERLWVEYVNRYYRMDDGSGVKAVTEPALADALRQVEGYRGFDAEAYWQMQSVTTDLRKLLQNWNSQEQNDKEKESDVVSAQGHQDVLRNQMAMTQSQLGSGSGQVVPQQPAQPQSVYSPAITYTSYNHPAIARRKIDESYEFDEDFEDTEMT